MNVKVDMKNRQAEVDGIMVDISNPQWEVLECFSHYDGVTVEKIAQRVYGSQTDRNKIAASVIVSRLKKILGKDFLLKQRGSYVINPSVQVTEKNEEI